MYFRVGFTILLLGFLIFILNKAVEVRNLPQIILSFPKEQLFILIVLSILISILKASRFWIILRNSNIKVSFLTNLKAFMASQAISPLPGGESMRGILIHKETGADLNLTTGPVITQAYLEVLSGALLGLIGSLVYKFSRIPISLFLVFLLILAFSFSNRKILIFLSIKFSKIKYLNRIIERLLDAQKNIKSHLIDEKTKLPDKVLVRSLILSLMSNILGGYLLLLIARNYGVDINIFQATFVNSASIIIQALSAFSPGGIGLTEGGMTGIFLSYNIPIAQAIAIVLVYRLMTLFFNVIIGLLILLVFYSKSLIFKSSKK